jgi:uroporphyrinogen decarboxylase
MSKRERVEATLNLQETDRVPVYDILINDAAIEYFSGKYPPTGEEGLKIRLQATARILDMTRMTDLAPQEPGELTDEDGFVHFRDDRWIYGGILRRPFSDTEGAKRWLGRSIQALKQGIDLKTYRKKFLENSQKTRAYLGDDTVVLTEYGTGLDWVRTLLGLELFSYLSFEKSEMITEYIELYTALEIERIHATADRKLSPCALTYGDIAYKGALLHSPEWLRQEFFPKLKKLNEALHEHGIKCLFHSDGYLMDVMLDLLNSGIDGLNPIEVLAGMDLKEVKKLYGDKIFLAGGIDVSQLMSRSHPREVRRACQEAIEAASPGYFLGSTTELDNGSKLENIIEMVQAAWGYPVRDKHHG